MSVIGDFCWSVVRFILGAIVLLILVIVGVMLIRYILSDPAASGQAVGDRIRGFGQFFASLVSALFG